MAHLGEVEVCPCLHPLHLLTPAHSHSFPFCLLVLFAPFTCSCLLLPSVPFSYACTFHALCTCLHLFVPGSTQSILLVPFTLFMSVCTLCTCLHPLVPFVSAPYHLPLLMPTCTLCTYACASVLTCTCSYLKLHINVTF